MVIKQTKQPKLKTVDTLYTFKISVNLTNYYFTGVKSE